MIADHPSFKQPSDSKIPLWRYLDLPKFLSLLQTGRLFFARADLLGDPFEGSMSAANINLWKKSLEDEETRKLVFGNIDEANARKAFEASSEATKRNIKNNFISCWHANEYESAAMWAQYGRLGEAIALRTTYEKLAEELPSEVHMGEVRYIDYDKDFIQGGNLFNPFLCKRRSFEHEREVRAIIWSMSATLKDGVSADDRVRLEETGATVSVSLEKFIDRVLVGPAAPEWFAAAVEDVSRRYGLDVPIVQSSLAAKPIY